MAVVELTMSHDKHDGYVYAKRFCGKWAADCSDASADAKFTEVRNLENASNLSNQNRDMFVGAWWDNISTGPRANIVRSLMRFSVPSGTSTSGKKAVLHLYGRSLAATNVIGWIGSSPNIADIQAFDFSAHYSSNANLHKRDYSGFGTTAYSSRITGLPVNGGWIEVPLNSDALTAIESAAGGTFDIGVREYSHDLADSNPGLVAQTETLTGAKSYVWQFASKRYTTVQPRIAISDAGFNHKLLGIENTGIKKVNDLSMSSPQVIERINDIQ